MKSKMIFLGDIAFTGLLSEESNKNQKRFNDIVPFLSKDFVFANLEVPIKVDNTQNEYKSFIHYSSKQPTKELLNLLNIGCVSLANNHIYDCKMSGLKATIDTLDELGIFHTGAGWKKEHINPVIITNQEEKIAFLAYVEKGTNPKTENFKELFINYFSLKNVEEDIKSIDIDVDKIIVSIHWGVDYSHYPTLLQKKYAKDIIDFGADIIMGHHPHTIQPFEVYKDKYIFYSLGGLVFGDHYKNNKLKSLPKKTKRGVMVKFENENFSFLGTKDKKGNFVTISSFDFEKWSHLKMKINSIVIKFPVLEKVLVFKENVLDPTFEYFFGYYNNPIKRLFQLSNVKKIGRLFNRYRTMKSKKI